MAQTKFAGQIRTVEIVRGLFIIRYASADDPRYPPIVNIGLDTAGNHTAQLILHPDASEPVLGQPGSSLIVRADRPVKLRLEVTPRRASGSVAADIGIERLTLGDPTVAACAADTSDIDLSGVRLLGHAAGIGDVAVGLNEWVAGPSAPSRIEGITIEWPDKPPDFDIRYSVKLGAGTSEQSRAAEVGTFAGTRGRALPLTGIALELAGVASSRYRLCVEAAFLGQPRTRATGTRIVLSGPTGREPLVGLRINIERADAEPVVERRASKPPPVPLRNAAKPANARPASRVRVFRSLTTEIRSMG